MADIIQLASEYATQMLNEKISPEYSFHNFKHTQRIVKEVNILGKESEAGSDELEILNLAAWFHDTGYTQEYSGHEENSKKIAEDFLIKHEYPSDKLVTVLACIDATNLDSNPETILEKIMSDADLIHLGKKGFFKRNQELRDEFDKVLNKTFSDEEWLAENIKFVEEHSFLSEAAQNIYGFRRIENLEMLKQLLLEIKAGNAGALLEKIQPADSEKTKRAGRGIETMFRLTSKNHFTLSSIADAKAASLISISAIIISIIVSVLIRKLDTNPELVLPTVIILFTLMGTIIFAVLATRPKITNLTMTRDDVKQKKGNLLFFGNFVKMSVEEYEWSINELMNDEDYLYNSMIRDIYYLGLVLGKKYRHLKTAYNIFMFGLIASVISYILTFAL